MTCHKKQQSITIRSEIWTAYRSGRTWNRTTVFQLETNNINQVILLHRVNGNHHRLKFHWSFIQCGSVITRHQEVSIMSRRDPPVGGNPISVLCLLRCLPWRGSQCWQLSHL